MRPALSQPAIRKKVTISYWTWSDNPSHHKMVLDSVDMFNKSQRFVTVQVDADSKTMEVRQRVVAASAAGAGPDIAGTVQTHVQDYFDNGILQPIDDLFNKWDQKDDYFPSIQVSMRASRASCAILVSPRQVRATRSTRCFSGPRTMLGKSYRSDVR